MSLPPMPGAHDEVDDRYRRASALDPSRPAEAVRRKVLEHAAQLAAERTGSRASAFAREASVGRRLPRPWRPVAIFGTLAAAAIAGIMIAPRFLVPPVAPSSRTASMPVEPIGEPKLSQRPPPAPAPALEMAPFVREEGLLKPEMASPPAAFGAPIRGTQPLPMERARRAASAAPRTAQANERNEAYAEAAPPDQRAAADANSTAKAAAAKATDSTAAFRHAAETGDLRTLDRLLAMQPDINAPDAAGRTPLMLAILRGQTDVVSALLAYGADPNAADNHGTTPLQAARAGAHPAIIAALQRYGAR